MTTVKILVDNIEIESIDLNDGNHKGDLISRQAVKDIILGGVSTDTDVDKEYVCGLIDSLPPVENKGEWIPVSERLPEKNEWVLVSIEQPSGDCYQEIMRIDKYRGLWTDNFDYYADYVKAWIPLPEPYKKGEVDGK